MLTPLIKDLEHLKQIMARLQNYPQVDIADEYGEPGYSTQDYNGDKLQGILLSDWNPKEFNSPESRRMDTLCAHLEKYFSLEWYHEWTVLHEIGDDEEYVSAAYRISGDCYGWTSSLLFLEGIGEYVSHREIAKDPEKYFPEYFNQERMAWTVADINLEEYGFIKVNSESYANGWYPGQTDNPAGILSSLQESSPETNYIFEIDSVGQFDIQFSIWQRPMDYIHEYAC